MKSKKLSTAVVLIVTLFLFCSCEHEKEAPHETGFTSSVCVVLKFKKPEYKDMVLASHFEGDDFFTNLRGNWCGEPIGKAGYSPYWELPDGWLLVDWKWFDFPYAISTALTEQTWDKYEWSSGLDPEWPLSEPHTTEYPIAQKIHIKLLNLAVYSNRNLKEASPVADGGQSLCEKPKYCDSIWSVLQDALSVAIQNGDLEKINNDEYYDQTYYDNY